MNGITLLLQDPMNSKLWKKQGIRNFHLSHPDFIPVSLVVLFQSAEILKKEIDSKQKVYVHCKAGRGRSASAILSYLMTFKGWSFDKAFSLLKGKRSHIAVNSKKFNIQVLACLYEIIEQKKTDSFKKLSLLFAQP